MNALPALPNPSYEALLARIQELEDLVIQHDLRPYAKIKGLPAAVIYAYVIASQRERGVMDLNLHATLLRTIVDMPAEHVKRLADTVRVLGPALPPPEIEKIGPDGVHRLPSGQLVRDARGEVFRVKRHEGRKPETTYLEHFSDEYANCYGPYGPIDDDECDVLFPLVAVELRTTNATKEEDE